MSVVPAEVGKVLLGIEAALDRQGWDEDPMVHHLYRHPEDPSGVRLRARSMKIPARALLSAGDRPYLVLAELAELLRDYAEKHGELSDEWAPWGIVGAAWSGEMWMLVASEEVPYEEVDAVGNHRNVHAHPRRQETRNVYGVTLDGKLTVVEHVRGEKPEVTLDCGYQGDLLDALRTYTKAVLSFRPKEQAR